MKNNFLKKTFMFLCLVGYANLKAGNSPTPKFNFGKVSTQSSQESTSGSSKPVDKEFDKKSSIRNMITSHASSRKINLSDLKPLDDLVAELSISDLNPLFGLAEKYRTNSKAVGQGDLISSIEQTRNEYKKKHGELSDSLKTMFSKAIQSVSKTHGIKEWITNIGGTARWITGIVSLGLTAGLLWQAYSMFAGTLSLPQKVAYLFLQLIFGKAAADKWSRAVVKNDENTPGFSELSEDSPIPIVTEFKTTLRSVQGAAGSVQGLADKAGDALSMDPETGKMKLATELQGAVEDGAKKVLTQKGEDGRTPVQAVIEDSMTSHVVGKKNPETGKYEGGVVQQQKEELKKDLEPTITEVKKTSRQTNKTMKKTGDVIEKLGEAFLGKPKKSRSGYKIKKPSKKGRASKKSNESGGLVGDLKLVLKSFNNGMKQAPKYVQQLVDQQTSKLGKDVKDVLDEKTGQLNKKIDEVAGDLKTEVHQVVSAVDGAASDTKSLVNALQPIAQSVYNNGLGLGGKMVPPRDDMHQIAKAVYAEKATDAFNTHKVDIAKTAFENVRLGKSKNDHNYQDSKLPLSGAPNNKSDFEIAYDCILALKKRDDELRSGFDQKEKDLKSKLASEYKELMKNKVNSLPKKFCPVVDFEEKPLNVNNLEINKWFGSAAVVAPAVVALQEDECILVKGQLHLEDATTTSSSST